MRSIRRVLLAWLSAIVLIGVVLAGVLIYHQARSEANALFDYQLQQTAAALPSEPFSSVLGGHTGDNEGVVIQIWSRDGVQLYYSHPRAPLAPRAELGFSTERTPEGDWRVYSAIVGDNVVQLAQPMAIRDLLAAETAWRTVWPLLVLLPVLGIGVWLIVGRGLRPLSRLAKALEARGPGAVDPLPDRKLATEIRPVVHALNGLLSRLNDALDTQKAFVADAAHELRTPLAALRIQAQLLERADDDASRAEALVDLKAGVTRATRLVEQLLSLARADPVDSKPHGSVSGSSAGSGAGSAAGPARPAASDVTHGDGAVVFGATGGGASGQPVDLLRVIETCVAAHAPLAIDKGVDLGIEAGVPTQVAGDADALQVMVANLIDNAVKYTPSGGRVDVSVGQRDGHAYIEIADTGPGIPEEERERVFDRFYRAPDVVGGGGVAGVQGSGLGLAIAKRVADRHHARIVLDDRRCATVANVVTGNAPPTTLAADLSSPGAVSASTSSLNGLRVRVLFTA